MQYVPISLRSANKYHWLIPTWRLLGVVFLILITVKSKNSNSDSVAALDNANIPTINDKIILNMHRAKNTK